MKLTELLTSPWAIQPESLREIQAIYATHLKGDKIDLAGIEARLGRPLSNEQQRYDVRPGGVAVLGIEGVLAPKANLFMQISGGASYQMLQQQVESAMADSRVKALVLAIDSPGGSVFGLPQLANTVRAAAAEKPVVSVVQNTMASAATWIGTAANAIFMDGITSQAGSIGVYASMQLDAPTPGRMEFVRGKYKRPAINGQAPSAEYIADFEAKLDRMYTLFVEAVADNRSTTTDLVLERMADARVFLAQQAIDVGLVDGIATLDSIVEQIATEPAKFAARRKAVYALGATAHDAAGAQHQGKTPTEPVLLENSNPEKKGSLMDRKELEQQHPALFAQLKAEFSAPAAEAITSATTKASAEGATAERDRIAAVRAQVLPGHEALIETLAFDGKTTGPEAAVAVLAAERTRVDGAAKAHFADAPKPAPASSAPEPTAKTGAQKAVEAEALAKSKGIDIVAALKELGYA